MSSTPIHDLPSRRLPCILGSINRGAGLSWTEPALTLDEIRDPVAAKTRFLVAFLTEDDLKGALASDGRQGPLQPLRVPSTFGTKLYTDASGFFSADHGDLADKGDDCYTTAFRFLVKHSVEVPLHETPSAPAYRWEKLGFVTFHPSPGVFTVFCFDIEAGTESLIRKQVLEHKLTTTEAHPLSIQALLLRCILHRFNDAVWAWRHVTRELERSRLHLASETTRDFNQMHEISRHLIHSTEMLNTALSVVECMTKECDVVRNAVGEQATIACLRDLESSCSLMRALLNRSAALEKRMENEIALAFHRNSQHDTSIASKIALSSQRDGQTTKGISILGMLFLPGTYVSALFSMSFFHFAPGADGGLEQWTVSPEFWMYWAVTIPVTVVTVGVWLLFQRWHSRSKDSAIEDQDSAASTSHKRGLKADSDPV